MQKNHFLLWKKLKNTESAQLCGRGIPSNFFYTCPLLLFNGLLKAFKAFFFSSQDREWWLDSVPLNWVILDVSVDSLKCKCKFIFSELCSDLASKFNTYIWWFAAELPGLAFSRPKNKFGLF